jgi:hypothetical protein
MLLHALRHWRQRWSEQVKKTQARKYPRLQFAPQIEALEERTLLSCSPNDPPPPLPVQFENEIQFIEGDGVRGAYVILNGDPAEVRAQLEQYNADHPDGPYFWGERPASEWDPIQWEGMPAAIYECVDIAVGDDCDDETSGIGFGTPIFVAQHQSFDGAVANFSVEEGSRESPDDYVAEIHWGDGSSDLGVISATGAGAFEVQGEHTWRLDGAYLVVVNIYQLTPDCDDDETFWSTVVGSPTFVVPLTDASTLQTATLTAEITGNADLTQSVVYDGDEYELTVTGSGTFSYQVDVWEPHRQAHREVDASFSFSELVASGTVDRDDPADFTLDRQSVGYTGEFVATVDATYADLDFQYTRAGTETYVPDQWEKEVDFQAHSYTLLESGSLTSDWSDAGNAYTGRYRQAESEVLQLQRNVHDLFGPFTRTTTQTDVFTRTEGGTLTDAGTFHRLDTHEISASWEQTGTDLGLSYSMSADDDQVLIKQDTTGAAGGTYTLIETSKINGLGGATVIHATISDGGGAGRGGQHRPDVDRNRHRQFHPHRHRQPHLAHFRRRRERQPLL